MGKFLASLSPVKESLLVKMAVAQYFRKVLNNDWSNLVNDFLHLTFTSTRVSSSHKFILRFVITLLRDDKNTVRLTSHNTNCYNISTTCKCIMVIDFAKA